MSSIYFTDFRDFITDAGLIPSQVEADGEIRRCGTREKPRSKNGWYVLFSDPLAGAYGDWGTDEKHNWSGNGKELDPEKVEAPALCSSQYGLCE